ncbi:MAG: hypothetical protein FWG42_04405 [Clostridiales bacterium]|nr:hypothetical protein [Clostridiales bacterium]
MKHNKTRTALSWLLVLGLVLTSGAFTFAGDFGAASDELFASAAADDPVKYAPVRKVETPVAGHYPVSFYRNTVRDQTDRLNTNAGVTQTLSWYPDIDDTGFATNTAYTAVLELEPVSNQWAGAGFPGTASFSANGLTWENLANLPTEGVESITSEYFTGPASGNYFDGFSGAVSPTGANMRVFIKFKPTAAVKSAPDLVFFDDFSGSLKSGGIAVEGTTTKFVKGPELYRNSMSYWTYTMSGIKPDPKKPGNKVLELGWQIADYDWVTRQTNGARGSLTENVRPAVPPTAFVNKNLAGNDVLEVLLDVAIYDNYWMGKDYIAVAFATTPDAWAALTLEQKLAAWNALPAELKLEVWNAYWPELWTNTREYGRRNYVQTGCWDLRGNTGGNVAPLVMSYGYYEIGIKMTPINGIWTAMWMPYDDMNGVSNSDTTIMDVNRVVSSNPMLNGFTANNKLTAVRNQASWSRCEIDIIENCEPVLERGFSSSLHYGGYSGYGGGMQHQENWMPGTPERINDINLYDGEFHRIGYEWSPTDSKFYIDDILHASASDISTHWPIFEQDKDQITMMPFLDGRLGIPQNPQYVRLSVEAAVWSGHGNEYEYYPYDCGVGIREDRSLGRITRGTVENGGAAAIDYIKIYNGPKPPVTVLAHLSTDTVSYASNDVEYTLSLAYAKDVLAAELEFEIDGSMLAGKGLLGLNGFEAMNGILWTYAGGDKWNGNVTLALPSGSTTGLTSVAPVDIAKFIFTPKGFGNATMALTSFRVVGLDGTTIYLDPAIGYGSATTVIAKSKYDLNRDGVVDALDLGIMLLYCGFDADSPDWSALIKVNDAWGNGVTASMCDVNSDGLIDMLDLLDLFIHYTK